MQWGSVHKRWSWTLHTGLWWLQWWRNPQPTVERQTQRIQLQGHRWCTSGCRYCVKNTHTHMYLLYAMRCYSYTQLNHHNRSEVIYEAVTSLQPQILTSVSHRSNWLAHAVGQYRKFTNENYGKCFLLGVPGSEQGTGSGLTRLFPGTCWAVWGVEANCSVLPLSACTSSCRLIPWCLSLSWTQDKPKPLLKQQDETQLEELAWHLVSDQRRTAMLQAHLRL